MRVVIDATPLLVRSAGVKNYLYHWIRHLRHLAGADVIGTFPPLSGVRPLTHEASVAGPAATFGGLAALALSNHFPLPILDWMTHGADVFHASVLVRHPPRHARLTATVHDLTGFLMPELHPHANLVAEGSFAHLARRAHRLIAVSESTKNDAIRVLGIAPEKITTIHSGIADSFFDPPPELIDDVRRRYGLMRPFVLFVGTIEPRKNLDLLLDAFESLPLTLREYYELVIAGPIGWDADRTVERLRLVRYLGYIPEPDLAPLTAAAEAFVYPSLYEGFGFPVAQAMAAGVPVITSNVSSLPEVAGNAALLVDPRSQSELHTALARLLTSRELRISLSTAGRERARAFRWEECAAKSLLFFRNVAEG
ncbi:MAG: glycosyl transferase, group 1 [Candidatus Solibacter sp.]|nr:glycosyl transferase, group 1 [Candidatus Solibacter sp.]